MLEHLCQQWHICLLMRSANVIVVTSSKSFVVKRNEIKYILCACEANRWCWRLIVILKI